MPSQTQEVRRDEILVSCRLLWVIACFMAVLSAEYAWARFWFFVRLGVVIAFVAVVECGSETGYHATSFNARTMCSRAL